MEKIFVSSTYSDIKDIRSKIRDTIRRSGHEDIAMEYFVADNERPLSKCLKSVEEADIYVGIFTFNYGFIPDGYDESITVLEYRRALELGKECLMFFLSEEANWPFNKIDIKHIPNLQKFREEARKRHIVGSFTSDETLQIQLLESLINRSKSKTKTKIINLLLTPQLPPYYVERTEFIEQIENELLSNEQYHKGNIITLHGIGGGGKTTIASAICQRRNIMDTFRDGVLWVTLGQRPDSLSHLINWIRKMGDLEYQPSSIFAASEYLRNLAYSAKILIVIDDVWDPETLRAFLVGGSSCKTIITTRRASITDELETTFVPLNELRSDEAMALLIKRINNKNYTDNNLSWIQKLCEASGKLPLALNLMGALIARGYSYEDTYSALDFRYYNQIAAGENKSQQLLKLESCIQLSLDWLRNDNSKCWEHLCHLSVLREDASINKQVAGTVWDIPEFEASHFLNTLADEAILQRTSQGYILHDLLYEMAKTKLYQSAPVGIGSNVRHEHSALLQNYKRRLNGKGWECIKDDGYITSNLFWHMKFAEQRDEQYALLVKSDENNANCWYSLKESKDQNASYSNDILQAWDHTTSLGKQIRYALMISSVKSIPKALSPEVLVKLLETGIWTPLKATNYIVEIDDFESQIRCLINILPHVFKVVYETKTEESLSLRKQLEVIIKRNAELLLPVTKGIEDVRNLWTLSSYLSDDLQKNIVEHTLAIVNQFPRGIASVMDVAPPSYKNYVLENVLKYCLNKDECSIYERFKIFEEIIKCFGNYLNTNNIGPIQSTLEKLRQEIYLASTEINSTDETGGNHLFVDLYLTATMSAPLAYDWKHKFESFFNQTDSHYLQNKIAALAKEDKSFKNESSKEEFERWLRDDNLNFSYKVFEFIDFLLGSTKVEDYLDSILDKLHWLDREKKGYLIVQLHKKLSSNYILSLYDRFRSNSEVPIGLLCILAQLSPEKKEILSEEIIHRLTYLVKYERKSIEDALSSIIVTTERDLVFKALRVVKYIGDEKELFSNVFNYIPLLKLGSDSAIMQYWGNEKLQGKQISTLANLTQELSISIGHNKLGEFIEEASNLSSEWWIVEALTMTTKKLSSREELCVVLRGSKHLRHGDLRARFISRVALRFAHLGFVENAIEALNEISSVAERNKSAGDLSQALSHGGFFEAANKISELITDDEEYSRTLAHICLFYLQVGNNNESEKLAKKIKSKPWLDYVSKWLFDRSGSKIAKPEAQLPLSTSSFNETDFQKIFYCINEVIAPWLPINCIVNINRAIRDANEDQIKIQFSRICAIKMDGKFLFEKIAELTRPSFLRVIRQLQPILNITCDDMDILEIATATTDVGKWWA